MSIEVKPGYHFERVNHASILAHSLLVSLTPLIPIPFLDDWVKSSFLRRMMRQIGAARGVQLSGGEVETLLQEDFWDSCVGGCLHGVIYLLRELLSKIFFFLEIRRALDLFSSTYYTGFLMDAALMEGYPLHSPTGSTEAAVQMREAIRRVLRENLRPLVLLSALWSLIRRAVGGLPGMIAALPGTIWRGIRGAPGRMRENFYLRVQVLLGKEKAPELKAIERMAQSMQTALLSMDPAHFDELVARLRIELAKEQAQRSGEGKAAPTSPR